MVNILVPLLYCTYYRDLTAPMYFWEAMTFRLMLYQVIVIITMKYFALCNKAKSLLQENRFYFGLLVNLYVT